MKEFYEYIEIAQRHSASGLQQPRLSATQKDKTVIHLIDGIDNNGPTIYIVRHAKTGLNNDEDKTRDKIRGWKNIPLDASGRQQAKELAQQFKNISVQKIYSSDLSRCFDTAKAISEITDADMDTTIGLRPWDLGDFQSKESSLFAKQLQGFITVDVNKPVAGGESFNSFRVRALDTFNDIIDTFMKERKNIVVVTHYRFVKLLESWMKAGAQKYNIDEKEFGSDSVPTGSVLSLLVEK